MKSSCSSWLYLSRVAASPEGVGYIEEVDDEVGLFHFVEAAFHTGAFDHIAGMLADAGGVDEAKEYAVYVEYFFDRVAGGAGYIAYDGAVFLQQGIEQGALAGIGFADDRYTHAIAYYIAQAEGVEQHAGVVVQLRDKLIKSLTVGKFHIFLREVELQLYEGREADHAVAQGAQLGRESAAHGMQGRLLCRFGIAGNEVGYGLGLGQVHLAMQEGALGKLTGAGYAGSQGSAGLHH